MTNEVKAAFDVLAALTPDALKGADEATLDRLQELAEHCEALIAEGHERRNPSPFENSLFLEISREDAAQRMAHAKARREARHKAREERQATLREAIGYCGTNPALRARLTAIADSDIGGQP
jgi:hypothetical protein